MEDEAAQPKREASFLLKPAPGGTDLRTMTRLWLLIDLAWPGATIENHESGGYLVRVDRDVPPHPDLVELLEVDDD